MKKYLLIILFTTMASNVFALATGTVTLVKLSSDTTDSAGNYTWTNYNGVTFEEKDGYNAAKFTASPNNKCVYAVSVAETIKTVTFDIWVTTGNGNSPDWRMWTTSNTNDWSIQYYSGALYYYGDLGGHADMGSMAWSNMPEGQWVNIGVTYDPGANQTKLYINNTLKGTIGCGSAPAGKNWYIANTSWSLTQGADIWVRNFRLMTTVETSFPVVDPPENSPTVTPTHTDSPTASPTFTPTPSITPTSTFVVCSWVQETAHAGWAARVLPFSASFKNKIWIMGGCSKMYPPGMEYYNDVWSSPDGKNWTRVVEHAPWNARFRGASFVYDGKMWIAGGVDLYGTYSSDVWYSSDGTNWTCATSSAGFGHRFTQTQYNVVFQNKMWIVGGQVQNFQGNNGCVNDVWYSSDGTNWNTTTCNAQFIPKSGGGVCTYNGKLWTAGGAPCGAGDTSIVWYSSDGILWQQAGSIWSSQIVHFNLFDLLGKLFMIGGAVSPNALDQTQWSQDGVTWHSDANGFGVRNDSVVEMLNGKLYLYAGSDRDSGIGETAYDDVWSTCIRDYVPYRPYDEPVKQPWEW